MRCGRKVLTLLLLLIGLGFAALLSAAPVAGMRDGILAVQEPAAASLSSIYNSELFARARKASPFPSAADVDSTTLGKAGASAAVPRTMPASSTAVGSRQQPMFRAAAARQRAPRPASSRTVVQAAAGGGERGSGLSFAAGAGSRGGSDALQHLLLQRGVSLEGGDAEQPSSATPMSSSTDGEEAQASSSALASKRETLLRARRRRDMLFQAGAAAAWLQNPWPSYIRSVAQARMADANSTRSDDLPVPLLIETRA
jgi:hypothetical protein